MTRFRAKMTTSIKALGLSALTLLSVLSLWAQNIESTFASQENAPVRWASMAAGGPDFGYGYLKNFSDKEVIAVQGGWVTFVGCVDTTKPRKYDVTLGTLKNVYIPPKDLSPEIGFGIWEGEARALMTAQAANRATIIVGIVRVVFADGTEWNLNSSLKADPSFDDDLEFTLAAMRTCFDYTELRAWLCTDPKNRKPPKGHENWAKVWKEMHDAICGTAE